jgi:adenine-specific DNA-methyltransferase
MENTQAFDIERLRRSSAKDTSNVAKARLGQYFTPAPVASFMASLFKATQLRDCRLLDAGAGVGSLTHAFLQRAVRTDFRFNQINIDAYEQDYSLAESFHTMLANAPLPANGQLHIGDFIERAVEIIQFAPEDRFTHAILNPPYKKLESTSRARALLRAIGLETVNLYSAFVGLALELLRPNGQLVAIIPRSFCNGPYYRPFREWVLQRAAIHHIHLFAARDKAFSDDGVLQENVILLMEREGMQNQVVVSTSGDDTLADLQQRTFEFGHIVPAIDNPERFIHIPTGETALAPSPSARFTLSELGLHVSTGPIVDFRLSEHLRGMPGEGDVPLLYPAHFGSEGVTWPKAESKKPNAIARNNDTERWLYPSGCYCIVRRVSSKEEPRRVVASVLTPEDVGDSAVVGLENHLNVIHAGRKGLPIALAKGLAVWLNTSEIDKLFRQFNGHTQVNATDLRNMRFPSIQVLTQLGEWIDGFEGVATQEQLDAQARAMVS